MQKEVVDWRNANNGRASMETRASALAAIVRIPYMAFGLKEAVP